MLQVLRTQPLIAAIDLNRGADSAQVVADYDPAVRSAFTQSADLALFSTPPLRGEGVHVAVLDQNIDSRHPALDPTLRPGFGVHHERCYAQPNADPKHLCQDPNTGGVPGTTTSASQSSGPGTARGPIDNAWAHGTGVAALVSGVRLPTSIPPVLPPTSTLQYIPPYLAPTENILLTAIRVTRPNSSARAGPIAHVPDLMLAGTAMDWVAAEAQSGNRPYVALNMSFGNTFEQSGNLTYNGNYAFQHCDYMLVSPIAISMALSITRDKTSALRDAGVLPFAATGNKYLNFAGAVDNSIRAERAPSYAACLSSVIGVSATWDSLINIPGLAAQYANGTSACDESPNRNACFAQRNKATKLAAPASPTTAWMTYETDPNNEQQVTSFSTNEVHAEVNNNIDALVGTSFSAPWAMACYAQLVQRFSPTGFPALDRRDLITELINNPARSTRVVINGATDPNDVELPLLQCQSALNRIESKLSSGGPFGLPINNRFTSGGAWNSVSTIGQGFVLEVNPFPSPNVPLVFGGWFTYSNSGGSGAQNQRWFALQSKSNLLSNASSIELDVFQVTGGGFNLPNSGATAVTITDVGDALFRIHNCVEASLQFSLTSSSFVGSQATQNIRLRKTLPPQRCHEQEAVQAEMASAARVDYLEMNERDFGRNGAWKKRQTTPIVDDAAGQGLFLEQNANADLFFGAWYTFDPGPPNSNTPAGERLRWFTLQPEIDDATERAIDKPSSDPLLEKVTYKDGTKIFLQIFRTTNGTFNSGATLATTPVGTATLTWVNDPVQNPGACNELDFRFQFNANAGEFAGLNNINAPDAEARFHKIGAVSPGCTGP